MPALFGHGKFTTGGVTYRILEKPGVPKSNKRRIDRTDENGDWYDSTLRNAATPAELTLTLMADTANVAIPTSGATGEGPLTDESANISVTVQQCRVLTNTDAPGKVFEVDVYWDPN